MDLAVNDLAREILAKRGISGEDEVRAFLDPACYTPTRPWELPGMRETVELVLEAVGRGEKICVYGDYDADGVTSTALLVSLLRRLGADVQYHVPDRFHEGYGMNSGVVRELASSRVGLILTCDCGISNLQEVALAKELGLKVLITDHHLLPPELPAADAIVNPQFLPPGHRARQLSGAGVAYMLASAVLERTGRAGEEREFLDLTALSIVADVVPLLGENRYLLQLGLKSLRRCSRPGLKALCAAAGIIPDELSEEDIAFQLAPRLNSAGRIASAGLGLELLLAADSSQEGELAAELDRLNQQRKALGDDMLREAQGMLSQTYGAKPIVLYQPHWHHGVMGIVAGRLAELYQVPALLMSLKEDGVTVTGSARSAAGVHVFNVLKGCGRYLDRFGGHAGAAGFSLVRGQLELFVKAIERELSLALENRVEAGEAEYDVETGLAAVDQATWRELQCLAPFGEGNPKPRFHTPDVEILSQRAMAEEKHLRLVLRQGEAVHQAVWWWAGGRQLARTCHVTYNLNMNRWQGRENLQLEILQLAEPDAVLAEQPLALELADLRNWQAMGRELPEFHSAAWYWEGGAGRPALPGKDRYTLPRAETLVMLSLPPGIRVWQEALALTGAGKVVLAYGQKEGMSLRDFLQQLAGLIKHAVSRQGGVVDIKYLAVATGQLEITAAAGLSALRDRGLINFEYMDRERIAVSKGEGKQGQDSEAAELRLKSLLAETRAFQRYLLTAPSEALGRLLQDATQAYGRVDVF